MYNWADAETAYVTGTKGYRKIADEFGIPRCTLSRYAKEHDWVGKRKDFPSQVSAKTVRKTAEKLSEIRSDVLALQADSALRIAKQINDFLTSDTKWKPFDLLRITNAWQILQDNITKDEEAKAEEQNQYVAILPDRTEIDEGG